MNDDSVVGVLAVLLSVPGVGGRAYRCCSTVVVVVVVVVDNAGLL